MRKKLLLVLTTLLLLGSSSVFSQDSGIGITAEIDCDPSLASRFSSWPTFVKVRYFVTDDIAVRLSGWVEFESDQNAPESSRNELYFKARPGVEYHLASSPGVFAAYVGAEVIFDYAERNFDTKTGVPITGAWSINNINNYSSRGFMSLGASVLGGADIYIGGSVYLGTELGLAYTYTNHAEVLYGNDLYLGASKGSAFKIDLSRVFRVGFRF